MKTNYKTARLELEKYVFPIYDGGVIIGQGFIADGYFITAGHILKDYPFCRININDSIKELSKYNPFYIGEGDYHDPNVLDVVIFRFDGINSSLHLSEYMPQKGEILESYCMHETTDPTSSNPQCRLSMEPVYSSGEEDGNYFYCNCERFDGSSGSPLLKNKEVVGIMHGGNNTGLCAFLKTIPIIHLVNYKKSNHQ